MLYTYNTLNVYYARIIVVKNISFFFIFFFLSLFSFHENKSIDFSYSDVVSHFPLEYWERCGAMQSLFTVHLMFYPTLNKYMGKVGVCHEDNIEIRCYIANPLIQWISNIPGYFDETFFSLHFIFFFFLSSFSLVT